MTLTAAQQAGLNEAIQLMLRGTAYETPFSEDVIQRVARVANSTGFATTGAFYERARNNPFSTLLQFIVYVGT